MIIIIITIGLLMINACFVVAEVSLLTSKQHSLEKFASEGSKSAKIALQLTKEPEKYLATVQTGITIISVVLGMLGGGDFAEYLEANLEHFPYIADYKSVISHSLVVIIITYFTVVAEIVPKRMAMIYPEQLAMFTAHGMYLVIKLLYPMIWLLMHSARFFIRLSKAKESKKLLTAEEMKLLINQAAHVGTVAKMERDMMRRLLHLGDMTVGAVMTPRSRLISIDLRDTAAINRQKIAKHPFSSFPLIDGDINNIVGMISLKSIILDLEANIDRQKLQKYIKPVLYVPDMIQLSRLLEIMKLHQTKAAIAVDEYGEIEGIVTINDIFKTFVGDIATLVDGQKPSIVCKRDGSYIVNGNILIEEIREILDIHYLPDEDEEEYRTLASFILKQLNRMPNIHDSFIASGWRFTVIKMEHFRIDKVQIQRIDQEKS